MWRHLFLFYCFVEGYANGFPPKHTHFGAIRVPSSPFLCVRFVVDKCFGSCSHMCAHAIWLRITFQFLSSIFYGVTNRFIHTLISAKFLTHMMTLLRFSRVRTHVANVHCTKTDVKFHEDEMREIWKRRKELIKLWTNHQSAKLRMSRRRRLAWRIDELLHGQRCSRCSASFSVFLWNIG